MTADIPYSEMLAERPAFIAPVQGRQSPTSAGYQIDWSALLRMNFPTQRPSPYIEAKQVLTAKTATVDPLAEEFPKLVKQWKEDTFFLSSLTKQFSHPAYVRIMAMGKDGLPLVLRELQANQGRWFYALKFMAGMDVAAGIKDSEAARAAWLEWGYKNNYI